MRILSFVLLFCTSFLFSKAAFIKDTSFITYKEFSHLSKKEIIEQFYKDDDSKIIINNYYKHKRRGTGLLFGIVPLTAIGIYFANLSANATNGMGSTVGLVLAILFLLPALILTIKFLFGFVFKKKPSKLFFYNELKEYFQAHYQK